MKDFKDSTKTKQGFCFAPAPAKASSRAPMKKAEGGKVAAPKPRPEASKPTPGVANPLDNKTGDKRDPEYGDFVIRKFERDKPPVKKSHGGRAKVRDHDTPLIK